MQVMNRSLRRSPRLTPCDRLVFGLCAAWIPLKRLAKCAVILKPASFTLALHKSRLMAISRSFQSRQVMQQFLLDRLIG